jgi:hypothetical protein
VAPYVLVAGAICTAVAFELLLAQLDPGAFWLLLPWLAITAVVMAILVLRRGIAIWRDCQEDVHETITVRWGQIFAP